MDDRELLQKVREYLSDKLYTKPNDLARYFNISKMKAIGMLKLCEWKKEGIGKRYIPL